MRLVLKGMPSPHKPYKCSSGASKAVPVHTDGLQSAHQAIGAQQQQAYAVLAADGVQVGGIRLRQLRNVGGGVAASWA